MLAVLDYRPSGARSPSTTVPPVQLQYDHGFSKSDHRCRLPWEASRIDFGVAQ